MKTDANETFEKIKRSFALAKAGKPAYEEFYPFLEALFLIQAAVKRSLKLVPLELSSNLVETKWAEGFPLLRRWEFPLDVEAAETILNQVRDHIPESNHAISERACSFKTGFG